MKKSVVRSFSALGKLWNSTHDIKHQVAMNVAQEEKPRKCRICGAEMEHIAGSNVYVCHGMIETPAPTAEDPNAKKMEPCTNFALAKR